MLLEIAGKVGAVGGRIVRNTNCLMAFWLKKEAVKASLSFPLFLRTCQWTRRTNYQAAGAAEKH